MVRLLVNVSLGALLWLPVLALAGENAYTLTIKDHKFNPAELNVPAGQKIKIVIDNQDPTPEEFESHDLNREKVIGAKAKGIVIVGPLKTGTYAFVGEFHEDMAKGVIVAR